MILYNTTITPPEDRERIATILSGIHEILTMVEDHTSHANAHETSVALRQALTYVDVARGKWGDNK